MELEELTYKWLAYLMVNYRTNLVGLLKQDGYQITDEDTDAKIRITIIDAVHKSQPFRNQLLLLIEGVHKLETTGEMDNASGQAFANTQTVIRKIFRNCSGTCNNCQRFRNCSGDAQTDADNCNENHVDCECAGVSSALGYDTSSFTPGGYDSPGSNSSGSSFFSGDTFKNILNSGLSYLQGSINSKTQQSNNNAALQLSAQQLAAAQLALQQQQLAAQNHSTTPGWLWPVLIGVPISVGLIIVIVIVAKKMNKKS